MCLGWPGRNKRKHFKILKTTARLSISDLFRSSAIRSRKSYFGRKILFCAINYGYLILFWNIYGSVLRYLLWLQKHQTPKCVQGMTLGWDGQLQTAHCGHTPCFTQHVTHDTGITVRCGIYTEHIQTIANIQHNADIMKQTATVLHWTKWWCYSHDNARAHSRFVSSELKP